ncbi:MAG: BamA/TamA family outer membrane protein [Rhizonema sp. PD37]|nr:BamA/TamA family outer membrane protein [Rhizonema sp. PD37]
MRVSSAAIFTLVSLASGNTTQKTIAAPTQASTQTEQIGSVVVPVTQETPAQVEFVAPPETLTIPPFSQNSAQLQSSTNKKSVVIPTELENAGKQERGNVKNHTTLSSSLPTPNPPLPTGASPTPPTVASVTPSNFVVRATDVQVVGATPELQQIVRSVVKTQVGGETSQSQLQKDVIAILDTGLLKSANVNDQNTSTGVNVVYQVEPVVVRAVQLSGAKVLTNQVALQPFQSQIGSAISPSGLKQAVQKIDKWYADNGYSLARVTSIKPNSEGILTLNVAEGVVSEIKFSFFNDQGKTVDDKGNPVKGRSKTDFLRQQLKLKPGQIFQDKIAQQDVQQLSRLGLFEKVTVAFEGDANKVGVVYQLKEIGAKSINLGGNYTADQGIVGTLTYRDQNFGGVNKTLSANVQVGLSDLQFDTSFTSPYRANNPDSLGYSVNAFRHRDLSETFDDKINLANGDRVREGRIGGSFSLQKPIDGWDTSLGLNYTQVSLVDRQGKVTPTDAKGNPLSYSGTGIDDLTTISFTATKDHRDNPLNPTQGSILSLSTEQSVPIGQGNISMNRLRANYSQYQPVKLFESKDPQVFAVNFQAGAVLGDLPPYDTFNLGGLNSVRGYGSGDVGSGRTYVLASAEYRFPIIKTLGGVLFADLGSDLGSGDTVLGDPAGVRGKPGTGFGYGAGIRFKSPFGLLRADYGINDQGESQLQFGIGQRF